MPQPDMVRVTTRQRIALGPGRARPAIVLIPGQPVMMEREIINAALDYKGGHGRRYLDAGLIRLETPEPPAPEPVVAQQPSPAAARRVPQPIVTEEMEELTPPAKSRYRRRAPKE
jgi:hypothetical protein